MDVGFYLIFFNMWGGCWKVLSQNKMIFQKKWVRLRYMYVYVIKKKIIYFYNYISLMGEIWKIIELLFLFPQKYWFKFYLYEFHVKILRCEMHWFQK